MTVGGYAYLDGEKHVRVVMAMDAIMQALIRTRSDIRLAFLHTPTNVFALPAAVAAVAVDGYAARGGARLWQDSLSAVSGRRFFQPNVREMVPGPEGDEYGVIDSLVVQQGPNYALAKWLQQWRALAAREEGIRVSANVAPSTATESVLKNGAMAAAYAGAGHFGMEVFQPETSNALMAALLVHDLRAEQSAANPALPLDHPLELFVQGANHGGLWRAPFQSRSVMEIAAALGWFRRG